jgi:hypothetical protein
MESGDQPRVLNLLDISRCKGRDAEMKSGGSRYKSSLRRGGLSASAANLSFCGIARFVSRPNTSPSSHPAFRCAADILAFRPVLTCQRASEPLVPLTHSAQCSMASRTFELRWEPFLDTQCRQHLTNLLDFATVKPS